MGKYRVTDRSGRTVGYVQSEADVVFGGVLALIVAAILAPIVLSIIALILGVGFFWQFAVSIPITPFPNLNGILVTIGTVAGFRWLIIALRYGQLESALGGSFWQVGYRAKLFRMFLGGFVGPFITGILILVGAVIMGGILVILSVLVFTFAWLFSSSTVTNPLDLVDFGSDQFMWGVLPWLFSPSVLGTLGITAALLRGWIKPVGKEALMKRSLGVMFWLFLVAGGPLIGAWFLDATRPGKVIFDTVTHIWVGSMPTVALFRISQVIVGGILVGFTLLPLVLLHDTPQ